VPNRGFVSLSPKRLFPDSAVVNECLCSGSGEVAVAAAARIVSGGYGIAVPVRKVNRSGAIVLKLFRAIRSVPPRRCGIEDSLVRLLGPSAVGVGWKAIFGPNYRSAERQATWCRAYALTDVTALVNALDVFDNCLLSRLYLHDPSLGSYQLGNIGGNLTSQRLRSQYPTIHALAASIHNQRSRSMVVHPRTRATGRVTGQIKFSYLRTAKALLSGAIKELAAKW
jgi:hypothetical protein